MKFRLIKNALLGGEISETALGRTDLPIYPYCSELLRNMIPMVSGGAYRRPGTLFNSSLPADGGSACFAPRLIPFVVSKTEAYCVILSKLVGGAGFIQVVRATDNRSPATNQSVTGAHPWRAAMVSNGLQYDEWHEVQYIQTVDIMHLVHRNHKPMRLRRTAVDTFELVDFDNGLTGAAFRDAWPYRAQNSTATTLQINTASVGTGRTVTASANFFDAAHVGAVFKVNHSGTYGCFRVTGYTNPTTVTVEVMVALGSTSAVATWWESAWSDYRGWPGAVVSHDGRIGYGGNSAQRDSIWFTQRFNQDILSVSSIANPEENPAGEQPFTLTLLSPQLNQIHWMSTEETLQVGTAGDEWLVQVIDPAGGFSCGNLSAFSRTAYGSALNQAVRIGNELIFASQGGSEIKSLVFNQDWNTYVAEPLQLLFDHYPVVDSGAIGAAKIRGLAWDESRKTLWCHDTAGDLFGMTRDRALQFTAWHSHRLGGCDEEVPGEVVVDGMDTSFDPVYLSPQGSVVSVAVVPNPSNQFNDLWLAVKRKVDGDWFYHFERMIGGPIPVRSVYASASSPIPIGHYFVDAAVWAANTPPETKPYSAPFSSGDIAHLEGLAVEGNFYAKTGLFTTSGSVDSGAATISGFPGAYASSLVQVVIGLPFQSIVKPVRPDAGSQIGTAQGAVKRTHRLTIRFYRTINAKVGRTEEDLDTVYFRDGTVPMGKSADLFTGDKTLTFQGDYDRDGYLYIIQDKPLPFAVMAIIYEGQAYD